MKQKRDAYVKRLNDIYYANLERVCLCHVAVYTTDLISKMVSFIT